MDNFRIEMFEAQVEDLRGLYRQTLHTYADIIENQKRIFDCEERINVVYQRLTDLANKECTISSEIETAKRVAREVSDMREEIYNALMNKAGEK